MYKNYKYKITVKKDGRTKMDIDTYYSDLVPAIEDKFLSIGEGEKALQIEGSYLYAHFMHTRINCDKIEEFVVVRHDQ